MKGFIWVWCGMLMVWCCWVSGVCGASPNEWASRTIYQLLTDRFADGIQPAATPCADLSNYCGGTFEGILSHLDYIQHLGFDAIWISPIVVNTKGGYHGYWALNLEEVNDHFGSKESLQLLIQECHRRGIYVMLDVVANHMGNLGTDYARAVPFNEASDYHSCAPCPQQCSIQDYTCFNGQIELCRLSGLPDLNQSNPRVGNYLTNWIHQIVQDFAFDGLRIDTVPEVAKSFWSDFQSSAGVYAVGEVWSDLSCTASYQKVLDGVLSYPMCFQIRNCFQQGESLENLASLQSQLEQVMVNTSLLGTFVDNHDNPRFLNASQVNLSQYKSALTFVLYSSGIPIIYYGTEQGFHGGNDPQNREDLWRSSYDSSSPIYVFLKKVIAARKEAQVWFYPHTLLHVETHYYAWARGDVVICLSNLPTSGTISRVFSYDRFADGTQLCDLLNPFQCESVIQQQIRCTVHNGHPTILIPTP